MPSSCVLALNESMNSRHDAATGFINEKWKLFVRLITMLKFSDFSSPYSSTTQLVVSLASLLLVYGIYKILAFVYDELTSPLRHVPGPPSPSFIYGSMKQLSESVSKIPHCLQRLLTVNGNLNSGIRIE